jgi:hypothetical protein
MKFEVWVLKMAPRVPKPIKKIIRSFLGRPIKQYDVKKYIGAPPEYFLI